MVDGDSNAHKLVLTAYYIGSNQNLSNSNASLWTAQKKRYLLPKNWAV